MNPISQEFAPPFKLIAPFFKIGVAFYLLSILFLTTFTSENLFALDTKVLALAHLFLLGFVMMIIFGAMAQLVPVVLEVGHAAVELFYAIWPLLAIGTILMVGGFLHFPIMLPFGGIIVLVSMSIFIAEIFATIKKVEDLDVVMTSVLVSNLFLAFGIGVGFVMSLGYAGVVAVDVSALLKSHVFFVLGGYIATALMGLSVVLLAMFGLSHGFSKKPLGVAIWLMSGAVILVFMAALTALSWLENIAFVLAFLSFCTYFYLVYTIYKTRARKEIDIYTKSLFFAYGSLVVSVVVLLGYSYTQESRMLLGGAWLIVFGFFAFAITGHLYKIVPFLVWFERFSPLVGKQKVPMLAEMLPKRSSSLQFWFASSGVSTVFIAILLENTIALKIGAVLMVLGALALLKGLYYMMNYSIK